MCFPNQHSKMKYQKQWQRTLQVQKIAAITKGYHGMNVTTSGSVDNDTATGLVTSVVKGRM